jgi:hypothetical protein
VTRVDYDPATVVVVVNKMIKALRDLNTVLEAPR